MRMQRKSAQQKWPDYNNVGEKQTEEEEKNREKEQEVSGIQL